MQFRLSDEVLEAFPQFCVAGVIALGVNNNQRCASAELKAAENEAGQSLAEQPLTATPSFQAWRQAFAQQGLDPEQYLSAGEALLRRVAQGERLPSISAAVDLGNAVSLRWRVPIGAHDIDRLSGDFVVRQARAGDQFTPVGASQSEELPGGDEIVYADEQEVRTRRWVWRLGENAKITRRSQNIFFPIDGFLGVDAEAARAAAGELAELVRRQLGGEVVSFFVDRDQPAFTLPRPQRRDYDDVERLLWRGMAEAIPEEEAERRLRAGEKLRIYIGIDPTGATLHLGHAVALRKLRQFQQQGHQVIFLIGDFTGRIGDPTDRSAARVQLTREEVVANATSYIEQAGTILEIDHPTNPIEIRYNGAWWDEMTMRETIELAANFTVQQMLQRDMFQKRLAENKPISLHEFLYPLLQGYDSVALDVDGEIGGTDQTFNMLAGRTLLKALKDKEKLVFTVPLLEGTDGRKMSKSFNNIIGVMGDSYEMYARVMSLKDELIVRYFELCTDVSERELGEIERQLAEDQVNPMQLKKKLAAELVTFYHGTLAAGEAAERFVREVQNQEQPEEMPEVALERGGEWPVLELLLRLGLVSSKGEARRLIEQGSVQVDGERVGAANALVQVADGCVVRARRRQFARLRLP